MCARLSWRSLVKIGTVHSHTGYMYRFGDRIREPLTFYYRVNNTPMIQLTLSQCAYPNQCAALFASAAGEGRTVGRYHGSCRSD
jgi:hypothetical protein